MTYKKTKLVIETTYDLGCNKKCYVQKDVPSNKQQENLLPSSSLGGVQPENQQSDSQLLDVPTAILQNDVINDKSQDDVISEKPQDNISSDKPEKSVPELNNFSLLTNNQDTNKTGTGIKKSKPYRPCLFCKKAQSNLALHLRRKHAHEERVKKALLLPNILRDREFDKIRKDGIFEANCKILLDKNLKESDKKDKIMVERRQGKKDLLICSACNGFYATSTIYKHKHNCPGTDASKAKPTSLPVSIIVDEKDPLDFRDHILAKFRRDKVGDICRRDAFIKLLGQQNFNKIKTRTEKKVELIDAIMKDMRRFATLFLEVKLLAEKNNTQVFSSVDILKRENFTHLKDAIVNLTEREDGTVKSGLKIGLGFLIKKAAKVLERHYLLQQKDAEAADVGKFSTVLSHFWTSMFSDAEYANVKARQLDLRRPKHLPIEEDIQKLRNYTLTKMEELLNPHCIFTASEYISLRDVIVCRLTLFNARRGGEASRLLMQEWNDAENGEWINDASVQSIDDPIEKQLIGKFKIAFQSGKNLNQLVPLLIPNDCLKGIRKLANLAIRQSVGVDKTNMFLFPNTKNSEKHIIGWHAVRNVCIEAGLPKHITATSMRHRAATAYAALDVPENERQIFYRHMGHSKDMNRNVYQCPLAVQEVTKVGKFLETLDTVKDNDLAFPDSARKPGDSQNFMDNDVHSDDDSHNSDNYHSFNTYLKDSEDSESDDGYIAKEIVYNTSTDTKDNYIASTNSARMPIQTRKQCFAAHVMENTAGPSRSIQNWRRRKMPESVVVASSIESNPSGPSRTKSRRIVRELQGSMNSAAHKMENTAGPSRAIQKRRRRKMPESVVVASSIESNPSEPSRTKSRIVSELQRSMNSSDDSHTSDDGNYSEIDKDYSPHSEESSDMDSDDSCIAEEILCSVSFRKKGQRISWSTEDTECVREHFSIWVDDTSTFDRKGSLPGKSIITEFLAKYPNILRNYSMKKRVSLMRTKLYNERNKSRRQLKTYISPMCK